MVGSPIVPDLEAFPRFKEAHGYVATLVPGDLLYIPLGWFHWFRNRDHLAISMSFFSDTSKNTIIAKFVDDLDLAISNCFHNQYPEGRNARADYEPDAPPPCVMKRMMRIVEVAIAMINGDMRLCETMERLRVSLLNRFNDLALRQCRMILTFFGFNDEKQQDCFLLEMIEGRFGIDYQKHVSGGGRDRSRTQSSVAKDDDLLLTANDTSSSPSSLTRAFSHLSSPSSLAFSPQTLLTQTSPDIIRILFTALVGLFMGSVATSMLVGFYFRASTLRSHRILLAHS